METPSSLTPELAFDVQCIARDVDGKREVAGVHWDYDCYGAPGKMAQVSI